jgi:hypothetical protein
MFENDDELKKRLGKNKPTEPIAKSEISKDEFLDILDRDDVQVGVTKIDLTQLNKEQLSVLETLTGLELSGIVPIGAIDGSTIHSSGNTFAITRDINDLEKSIEALDDYEVKVPDLCNVNEDNVYFRPYLDFIKLVYNNTPFDMNYVVHACVSTLISENFLEIEEEMEEKGEDVSELYNHLVEEVGELFVKLQEIKSKSKLKDISDFRFNVHVLAGVLQILYTQYMIEASKDDDDE